MEHVRNTSIARGPSFNNLYNNSPSSAPLPSSASAPSFKFSTSRPRVHFDDRGSASSPAVHDDEPLSYLTMRQPPSTSNDPDLDEVMRHYGIDQSPSTTDPTKVPLPWKPANSEHNQRLAAFAVSITNRLTNAVFAYPFVVLRRQCQVNHAGKRRHLTPFSLAGVIVNLQRAQGASCMWKGLGSSFMLSGVGLCAETAISEASRGALPHDISAKPTLQSLVNHLLLKSLSTLVVTPFYASHLVESVQSDMVSETPGLFSSIVDGISRLFGRSQSPWMLPLHKLLLPHLAHSTLRYLLSAALQQAVLRLMRWYARRGGSSTRPLPSALPPSVWTPEGGKDKSLLTNHYPELISGFVAELLCDVALFPLETALHRVTIQGTRTIIDDTDTGSGFLPVSSRYEGCWDCLATTAATEGYSGLYRGFGALILQYGVKYSVIRATKLALSVASS